MSDVEVIEEGDRVTPRPRGKDWGGYFDAKSRGTLPRRRQPPLDERDEILMTFMRDTKASADKSVTGSRVSTGET